eukprot:PhM_4_TR419/c4_g1_i1/m.23569
MGGTVDEENTLLLLLVLLWRKFGDDDTNDPPVVDIPNDAVAEDANEHVEALLLFVTCWYLFGIITTTAMLSLLPRSRCVYRASEVAACVHIGRGVAACPRDSASRLSALSSARRSATKRLTSAELRTDHTPSLARTIGLCGSHTRSTSGSHEMKGFSAVSPSARDTARLRKLRHSTSPPSCRTRSTSRGSCHVWSVVSATPLHTARLSPTFATTTAFVSSHSSASSAVVPVVWAWRPSFSVISSSSEATPRCSTPSKSVGTLFPSSSISRSARSMCTAALCSMNAETAEPLCPSKTPNSVRPGRIVL